MNDIGNKLIAWLCLLIFIAAIHLAGCDSANFSAFLWSKVIAAGLFGVTVLLGNVIKRGER